MTIDEIKNKMGYGGVQAVAKRTGLHRDTVRNVLDGSTSEKAASYTKVLLAAFEIIRERESAFAQLSSMAAAINAAAQYPNFITKK